MRNFLWLICALHLNVFAAADNIHLDKAPININDAAALQRGARIFVNQCQTCHSLKYMRYDALAKGIKITDEEGKVLDEVVRQNLMFGETKLSSPMLTAMPALAAERWFGVVPPDLSLVARSRGVDWLYTYLRSYYVDSSKAWGVNNLVYDSSAMPHVLENWQGIYVKQGNKLVQAQPGSMSVAEFDAAMADLVNFLNYVSEPVQQQRKFIGVFVILFLSIFTIFAFLLKREYWKDIK